MNLRHLYCLITEYDFSIPIQTGDICMYRKYAAVNKICPVVFTVTELE